MHSRIEPNQLRKTPDWPCQEN